LTERSQLEATLCVARLVRLAVESLAGEANLPGSAAIPAEHAFGVARRLV
jgi:hypothetical protein